MIQSHLLFRSWNEVLAIAADPSRTPGDFHFWVSHNYMDSLAVSLRRLTDPDHRTASFVRLLTEVEEDAFELTREWFVSRSSGPDVTLANNRFDALSLAGTSHMNPTVPRADRDLLLNTCAKVRAHVDQYIAHLDRTRQPTGLTLGEAHGALALIYRTYRRWYLILSGDSLAPLLPQTWEHVLAVPWIDDRQAADVAEQVRAAWVEITNTTDVALGS